MKKLYVLFASALFALPGLAHADLFVGKCGGKKIKGVNLTKACKKHRGKTIFRCKHKCVKRKKLKCVKRRWVVKASKACGLNNGKKSNQLKTRKCTPSQIAKITSDYRNAKTRALRIRRGVTAELRKKHSKKTRRQLKRVKRWINSIISKLNRKVRFKCAGNKGLCGGANAHTLRWTGKGVRLCSGYFNCQAQNYRAAVIVHELAHKAGANDAKYWSSCTSGRSKSFPRSLKNWSMTAESYEYWARFGFCVPFKTCPK